MAQAERASTGAAPVLAEHDLAPAMVSQLAEPVRQILDTKDLQKIVAFLKGYGGDVAEVMQYLQAHHGNGFCESVVAAQKKAAEPSAWDKLLKDGKLRLVETKAEAAPAKAEEPTQAPTPEATAGEVGPTMSGFRDMTTSLAGDKQFDLGSKTGAAGGKLVDHKKAIEHSHGKTEVENKLGEGELAGGGSATANAKDGVALAGNADAKAHLVNSTVAINSKPFTHELFGESVTAQFTLGLSAHTYAEAKGNLGVNVGWSGLAAKAELTGTGKGDAAVTGAASLTWAKKAPSTYAATLASNGAWRTILGKYLPAWAMAALPESRVQSWLTSLIELVVSGTSGDQLVLGASTSASARGDLGLPGLSFQGGGLHVKPGAGLAFGGADTNFDVQLGASPGMELLTLLSFGGGAALFNKLAPSLSIKKFLEDRLDASLDKHEHDHEHDKPGEQHDSGVASKLGKLRDKTKALDGNHSFAVSKGKQEKGDGLSSDGHDFTMTREKGGATTTRQGDEARKHHEAQTTAMANVPAKPGKLATLADKVLGDTSMTIASTSQHYSKTAIDKKTKEFEIAGAKGDVSGRALELEGNATGEITAGAKALKVAGNAGASAYLMGGQVQIATPDMPFTFLGEKLTGKVAASADAGAFAQVQGSVGLDVGFGGAGMNASLSGFAGVKAGLTASASLTWSRKPTSYYTDQIINTGAWKTLFGQMLPQWVLNRAPDKHVRDWITNLIEMLVHGNGDATVLGAISRGEGSAGIGAAGAFSARFQGGVLHCHGKGGITLGLGVGASADVALGLTDGMAMLGVMALKGGTDLFHMLQPSMNMMAYMRPLFSQMKNRELPEPKKAG